MKITNILLLAVLFGGCSMGINHNIATIEGQQYLISTPVYSAPFQIGIQWEGESSYKKIVAPIEEENKYDNQNSEIKTTAKQLMQEIFDNCQKLYPRNSFDVKKCIQKEINLL